MPAGAVVLASVVCSVAADVGVGVDAGPVDGIPIALPIEPDEAGCARPDAQIAGSPTALAATLAAC